MLNNELKIENLVDWIKHHAESRNKSVILIELDNTIASLANVSFAKKTGLAIHAIINCDDEHWQLNRDYCDLINLDFTRINHLLNLEDYMPEIDNYNDKRISYKNNESLSIILQKYSRIQYISETTNSLVLSNITRDDYLFIRNYNKYSAYISDIMPFANLSMATINGLFDQLAPSRSRQIEAICKIAPKPDLEIEWLYNANERSKNEYFDGIIASEQDPTKYSKWYTYTTSQKALIAKVHQIEKATRYKECNIPIFTL